MNIPRATWHDYPPSIEFESTDLPMVVVKGLASISLNQVNIRIRRGEVMSLGDGEPTGSNGYIFPVTPDKPETRVHGPDVVQHHNDLISQSERHEGLVTHAEQIAHQTYMDNNKNK